MADAPSSVTHGLTMKGAQLTWALLEGIKPVENRHMRLRSGWLVLHTGTGKLREERQRELAVLCPGIPAERELPHGFIMGAVKIERHATVADCAGTPSEKWASGPVVNVVSAFCRLADPVPHKGALGLWAIDAAVLQRVRDGFAAAAVVHADPSRLPPPSPIPAPGTPGRSRKRGRDAAASGAASSRRAGASDSSECAGSTSGASGVSVHVAAPRPRPPEPEAELLMSKLRSLVPGASANAAADALRAAGNNLCRARYLLTARAMEGSSNP